MGFWRGLAARILLTVAFSTTATALAVGSMVMDRSLSVSTAAVSSLLRLRAPELRQECQASPWTFEVRRLSGFVGYAYDVHALESKNPDAPSLDPVLLARIRAGEPHATRLYWGGSTGGGMQLRIGDDGPCSLVQMTWEFSSARRLALYSSILQAGLLAAAAALLGTMLFGVLPILKRLKLVEESVIHIGNAERYRPGQDEAPDAIGKIRQAMDAAHQRILLDEAELVRKQHALVEHLENISHDLATPAASLLALLEELTYSRPWGEVEQRLLKGALQETAYLSSLTEDLAVAEQLQAGLDPLAGGHRTELGQVVERVVLRMNLLGRARQFQVAGARPDAPLWVLCNPVLSERLISNLVRNALTHGQEGGHAAVLLETLPDARFRLRVIDDGPGVLPEELPRLKQRHFRGSRASQNAGTGLGLAIVGEICHRAGWSLTFVLESPRGLGVIIEGRTLAKEIVQSD